MLRATGCTGSWSAGAYPAPCQAGCLSGLPRGVGLNAAGQLGRRHALLGEHAVEVAGDTVLLGWWVRGHTKPSTGSNRASTPSAAISTASQARRRLHARRRSQQQRTGSRGRTRTSNLPDHVVASLRRCLRPSTQVTGMAGRGETCLDGRGRARVATRVATRRGRRRRLRSSRTTPRTDARVSVLRFRVAPLHPRDPAP
jgi:hypothetical protein